jgi:ribosomal protein S18
MKNKSNRYVTVNTKDSIVNMSIDQYSRWLCLIEAIDFIDKKCEEWGKNIEEIDWVKPVALQKYIDERFHSMKHDVTVEYDMGLLT